MTVMCPECGGDLTWCEECGSYHHHANYEEEHTEQIRIYLD